MGVPHETVAILPLESRCDRPGGDRSSTPVARRTCAWPSETSRAWRVGAESDFSWHKLGSGFGEASGLRGLEPVCPGRPRASQACFPTSRLNRIRRPSVDPCRAHNPALDAPGVSLREALFVGCPAEGVALGRPDIRQPAFRGVQRGSRVSKSRADSAFGRNSD